MNIYLVREKGFFLQEKAIPVWKRYAIDWCKHHTVSDYDGTFRLTTIPATGGIVYGAFFIKDCHYFLITDSIEKVFELLFHVPSEQLDNIKCND